MSLKKFSEAMGALAACLVIVIAIGGILAPFSGGMVVSSYAYGTDEEITIAGAVMNSGTISEEDTFINRPDSEAIPLDTLYLQEWNEEQPFGSVLTIEDDY